MSAYGSGRREHYARSRTILSVREVRRETDKL